MNKRTMKRKIYLFLMALAIVLISASGVFATDADSSEEYITVPVYDSMEEMQQANRVAAKAGLADTNAQPRSGCDFWVNVVRADPFTESCEIYLAFTSTFKINSIRFKELIVESEWIGLNYLKITSAAGKNYRTYNLGWDENQGQRTIDRDFNIPLSEDQVRVRTKSIQVYRTSTASWLSAKYNLSGLVGIN